MYMYESDIEVDTLRMKNITFVSYLYKHDAIITLRCTKSLINDSYVFYYVAIITGPLLCGSKTLT